MNRNNTERFVDFIASIHNRLRDRIHTSLNEKLLIRNELQRFVELIRNDLENNLVEYDRTNSNLFVLPKTYDPNIVADYNVLDLMYYVMMIHNLLIMSKHQKDLPKGYTDAIIDCSLQERVKRVVSDFLLPVAYEQATSINVLTSQHPYPPLTESHTSSSDSQSSTSFSLSVSTDEIDHFFSSDYTTDSDNPENESTESSFHDPEYPSEEYD